MKTSIFLLSCLFALHVHAQDQKLPLWSSTIPDGPGPTGGIHIGKNNSLTNIAQPYLIVHRPAHPNGTAILVISGGGYAHEEEGKESGPAADWLASLGVTAFELIYRLPGEGWGSVNVPFEDGQRAMRLIRSMAQTYHFDSHRVGVMGFSAGGHLAGMLATQSDTAWYTPVDQIDTHSARPAFAVLLYPVITMLPPYNHTHAYKELAPGGDMDRYSVQLHVTSRTPPAFLAQAQDDPISPVENSHLMYDALQLAHIPSELKIFPTGGHGWGMGKPGTPTMEWPHLFEKWAAQMKLW